MPTAEQISLIVKETFDLINSEDFDEILRDSATENGFYGKLCVKLKKDYTHREASKFKMAYNRNSWNYRNLVETLL